VNKRWRNVGLYVLAVITVIFIGTSVFDIPYFITNNRKIKKFYKWKPSKSIDQILKDIYIWLRHNKVIIKYFK